MFHGWLVVGGAFVSHLLSYGILTVAFGVFFPFMADALGLGRGLLASISAAARLVSAALWPGVGPRVDRRGPRVVMGFGVLSLAGGAAVLAAAGSAWHVLLGYGLVMAFGSVALGELTGDTTVARWFVRRRGRALAISTMGLSTAGIVLPLPTAFLIERFGWRGAWLALAGVTLVLGLAATAAMRRRPEDYGLLPDGADVRAASAGATAAAREVSFGARQATRTPAFWLLIVSTNLAGLGFFGVNLHLFSFVTDRGLSAALAATVITYLYTLHTVAKPLWGLIAERVHVRYCIAGCYAGGALGVLFLLGPGSMAWLVAVATVYGLTRGAPAVPTRPAAADYLRPPP